MVPPQRLSILIDKSNLWIFFRLLLLEILYGGETSKTQDFRRKNPSPFDSVRQANPFTLRLQRRGFGREFSRTAWRG